VSLEPPSRIRGRRQRRWWLLVVLAGLAWGLQGLGAPETVDAGAWRRSPNERPRIIAHGGGLRHAPGNTLEALTRAAASGVDVLEFDVQLSADDQLVLMHDLTVDRTTNGTGLVRSLPLAELQALNAAAPFEGPAGEGFAPEPIPTLTDVLAHFAPSPLRFIIELKNPGADGVLAAERLAEALRRFGVEDRVVVGSFHGETLAAFREASRGAVLTSGAPGEIARVMLLPALGLAGGAFDPAPVAVLQIPLQTGPLDLSAQGFIRRAQALGQAVQYWTINDRATMERLARAGADGIMTDDVPALRAVLEDQGFALPDPWIAEK
jgi:glycerophosphoryl diester phosphodiesterase